MHMCDITCERRLKRKKKKKGEEGKRRKKEKKGRKREVGMKMRETQSKKGNRVGEAVERGRKMHGACPRAFQSREVNNIENIALPSVI